MPLQRRPDRRPEPVHGRRRPERERRLADGLFYSLWEREEGGETGELDGR
jgi:hypothetical protein